MVYQLEKLSQDYITIIACVGDGHIPGMELLIKDKDLDVETIRLSALRSQKTKQTETQSGHFSISYNPPCLFF
jgi:hypothetical protein